MKSKKVLFIGFGDLAQRSACELVNEDYEIIGVARSAKKSAEGITYWRGAIADVAVQKLLISNAFDVVVITLTPDVRDESGYRNTYLKNLELLLAIWKKSANFPGLVIFVSSTSVYGQSNNEMLDESSLTEPNRFNGKVLLESERLLLQSGINSCALRFSGIYGPGRNRLINEVKKGIAGGDTITNRIHVEDCVGIIVFLCQLFFSEKAVPNILLATDSCPVSGREVREWVAEKLGYPSNHLSIEPKKNRVSSKRCSNKLLLSLGYSLQYPSYREGYLPLCESVSE